MMVLREGVRPPSSSRRQASSAGEDCTNIRGVKPRRPVRQKINKNGRRSAYYNEPGVGWGCGGGLMFLSRSLDKKGLPAAFGKASSAAHTSALPIASPRINRIPNGGKKTRVGEVGFGGAHSLRSGGLRDVVVVVVVVSVETSAVHCAFLPGVPWLLSGRPPSALLAARSARHCACAAAPRWFKGFAD